MWPNCQVQETRFVCFDQGQCGIDALVGRHLEGWMGSEDVEQRKVEVVVVRRYVRQFKGLCILASTSGLAIFP